MESGSHLTYYGQSRLGPARLEKVVGLVGLVGLAGLWEVGGGRWNGKSGTCWDWHRGTEGLWEGEDAAGRASSNVRCASVVRGAWCLLLVHRCQLINFTRPSSVMERWYAPWKRTLDGLHCRGVWANRNLQLAASWLLPPPLPPSFFALVALLGGHLRR